MEQRHFKRVTFFTAAQLIFAEQAVLTEVLDISLKGALVHKPDAISFEHDQPFQLVIKLDNDDTVIRMQVAIAHQHANHLGLSCQFIDIDSISHLRRLLELNLGDADLLERELAELSAAT